MDVQPCTNADNTLAIVNAIFNGFQVLALTILTAWGAKARNGQHRRDDDEPRGHGR